jgi:hypothetical protein
MKPHHAFVLLLILTLVPIWVAGCAHNHQTDAADANTAVHAETAKVAENAGAARQSIASADAKLQTVAAAPDVPAPAKATVSSARGDLKAADGKLADVVTKNVPTIDAKADEQKAASDKAVADATDKQRQHDERQAAFIVAVLVAALVFFAVERAFPVTYLMALIPAGAAGVVTFFAFGPVLHYVLHVLAVAFGWGLGITAVVVGGALAWYVYKRHTVGGFAAWFKNTAKELGKAAPDLHPDVSAVVDRFAGILAGFHVAGAPVPANGALEGTGSLAAQTLKM